MDGKEEEMKKKFRARTKVLIAVAVVISFATVLGWHQMISAKESQESYPQVSRTYANGYAKIFVNNSYSSYMEIIFHCNGLGSSVTQDEFNNEKRYVTMAVNKGGGGFYDIQLESSSGWTYENNKGNFTSLDVKISYKIPAHYQLDKQTKDAAFDFEDMATTGNIGHETGDHVVHKTFKVSAYSIGLSTYDKVRHFNGNINFDISRSNRTVYYKVNNGTSDFSWDFTDGSNFSFPTVSRRGYTFEGWIDQGTGWESSTDWIVCGGNYTEIAQWIANQYNVSFDDNGADSGNVSDSTATYDSNFTLPESGYKKKGYKFLGWSTNENATSPQYTAGQSFTYQTDGDTVFYAVWAKSDFEVKFHGNGSSAADYTANLTYNKSVSLPKNIFERPGYTFIGWAQKEDGDKEVPEEVKYTDGQAVKDLCEPGETCHLYAIWKKSDGSFETKNIIHDDKMFLGDVNLTGQNGTGYSNANIDSKSAHIDKEDDPGYFTDRYGSNNN